jgi:hypothetical protein
LALFSVKFKKKSTTRSRPFDRKLYSTEGGEKWGQSLSMTRKHDEFGEGVGVRLFEIAGEIGSVCPGFSLN